MVKIAEKIQYYRLSEIQQCPDFKPEDELNEGIPNRPYIKEAFEQFIDLHLEKLPDFERSNWPFPLDFQMHHCRQFFEKALYHGISEIVIVHGLGEGVLKHEVRYFLENHPSVQLITEINQGGAVRVRLDPRRASLA